MKKKEVKEFVQCECGSEYVVLEPQDIEELQDGLYMSIWTRAYDKPSFWHRFRHIWYTLVNGKPYTDQICMNLENVKELNKYLTNFIALAELEKKQNKKHNKSNTILIYPNKRK